MGALGLTMATIKPDPQTNPDSDEFTFDTAAELAAEEHGAPIRGEAPWYLAWRRLRRNYVALVAFAVFVLIVLACALAPVYAKYVAHTTPSANHITDIVVVSGKRFRSSPRAGRTSTRKRIRFVFVA